MHKTLEGVSYTLLPKDKIRNYVLSIAKQEWEPEDFDLVGEDLNKSTWVLEEVEVDKIKMRKDLLISEEFLKDVNPRIEKQKELISKNVSIPPLILRGSDYLIFDGYARTKALINLKVNKCLAYVGYRS